MKKSMLLAAVFCLSTSLFASSVSAVNKKESAPAFASERAKNHFFENYQGAKDAKWFTLEDNQLYCIFHQGTTIDRVFYDKRGYWSYTIVSYPPSEMTTELNKHIQDYFNGYHISYVNEIRSGKNDPVYIVNIENAGHIKVIKVAGDVIEVQQAFDKE